MEERFKLILSDELHDALINGRDPFPEFEVIDIKKTYNSIFEEFPNITPKSILEDFKRDIDAGKERGEEYISVKKWNLIPKQQYWGQLKRFANTGKMALLNDSLLSSWVELLKKNIITLYWLTELYGRRRDFPFDCLPIETNNRKEAQKYLMSIGFYHWACFKDGSWCVCDWSMNDLFSLISKYKENMSPEAKLILINRIINVVHVRGDISLAFIEGGRKTCDEISNS